MSWYTAVNGDTGMITDGDRVVGSVTQILNLAWQVEIMWSGPGGDITGRFDSFEKALCFIEGVEVTFDRWKQIVTLRVQP